MKKVIKQIYPLVCLYYLLTNWLANVRYKKGIIDTDSGSTHKALSVEQSVNYINEVFGDYKKYSGIDRFRGRVAEVGPGDNCGVGLLFMLDGCESVDLLDRFYSKRDIHAQVNIYKALIERYPGISRFLDQENLGDETKFNGIKRWYGDKAAAEEYFTTNTGYDFIISRAVLEHLYDPLHAIDCMINALNPGGILLHKIDLRDHSMFSTAQHELKFLEPSDWLYNEMTKASGRPNRILVNEYRQCLEKRPVLFNILVTRLANVGDIAPHVPYEDIPCIVRERSISFVRSVRHRFAYKFRNVTDADLSVTGIFIIAKKQEPI